MGHNKAGENRKLRIKRRKKQDLKLKKWAKEWSEKFNTPMNVIYAKLAVVDGCDDKRIIFCVDELENTNAIKLPYSMLFREAIDYCYENYKDYLADLK